MRGNRYPWARSPPGFFLKDLLHPGVISIYTLKEKDKIRIDRLESQGMLTMNLKQIFLFIIGGMIAVQITQINFISNAKTTLPSRRFLAQETTPNIDSNSSQNQPQETGRSRRRDVRYRFECNSGNQTILALYKGTRSRSSSRVSWHRAGERQLIQWTEEGAQEFGGNLTASDRCRAVTTRFNQHFLRQSTQPTVPPLSEGVVHGMPVICAAESGECNPNNILWTLKPENRDTKGRIIAQLLSALKGEAGTGLILESEDDLEITSIPMDSLIDGIIMQESDRLDALEFSPDEIDLDDEFGEDRVILAD